VFRTPVAAGLLAVSACSGAGGPPPGRGASAARPALVVLVSVDQLRPDYLERFAPQLNGGLARLQREGAVFTAAFQDHAVTATAPGHATMLSGREPYSTGIVRNDDGVPDPRHPLLEVQGPGASPWRFRGTTLVDWLMARDGATRVLSVSRKDRGAILPVGRARQHVYWYSRGSFTTSTWYRGELPPWVRSFNAEAMPRLLADRVWRPLLPESAFAEPDAQPWEHRGNNGVFPHERRNPLPLGDRDYEVSPALDEATVALALRGVRELSLGRRGATDVLVVSLSGTDDIGHAFGPWSREIRDQIVRVDRLVGALLDTLEREVGRGRIVVALTADHGVTQQAERALSLGLPAGRYSGDSLGRAFGRRLEQAFGPGRLWRYFDYGMLVLDRDSLRSRGVDVSGVLAAYAEELRALPGVLRVETRESLAGADTVRDSIARRWLKAIPPDLAIGLMVTLRQGWVYRSLTPSASHGGPWDDDAHVPLVLWGAGVRGGRHGARVSVADLAPTLARLAGVAPLERPDGRVLEEVLR
jgi:arylsulfatase A-like enzyme